MHGRVLPKFPVAEMAMVRALERMWALMDHGGSGVPGHVLECYNIRYNSHHACHRSA